MFKFLVYSVFYPLAVLRALLFSCFELTEIMISKIFNLKSSLRFFERVKKVVLKS